MLMLLLYTILQFRFYLANYLKILLYLLLSERIEFEVRTCDGLNVMNILIDLFKFDSELCDTLMLYQQIVNIMFINFDTKKLAI